MFINKHLFFSIIILFVGTISIQEGVAQDSSGITIEDPMRVTPRQVEIREITVTGLETARESYVLSSSALRVGNRITIPGEEISYAIRQLNRSGIFSDVKIYHEFVSGGGVHLEIEVQEQPRLHEYEITGVRRSHRRDLRERIRLPRGFAVTNSARNQALNTIYRYYREKGHWNTNVEILEELNETTNRVTLTFEIDRGDRIKVREINFSGNEGFSDSRLRKSFSTIKQDRWWRIFKRHVYTQDEYEEGLQNVLSFYRDHGHRDVRVVTDTVYVDDWRGKDGVMLDIQVYEGPQYRVRNVNWEGNTVYTDEQLTQTLGFEKGDVFNQSQFQENLEGRRDEGDIRSLYENVGYLFFQNYPEIRIVEGDSLDLNFHLVEDDIATIRAVSFSGNTKTHDDVIRRTLRTVPGHTYRRTDIIRSIRELGQLGYFSPEGISPDLIPDYEEKTVDILYDLDETQGTDNFELSGGFGGRNIGIILAARVNFNNFSVRRMFEPGGWNPIPSGDGQRLSLGVQMTGGGYQSYSFSFTEPWFRGRPTSLGLSLSYDFLDYSRQRLGSSFSDQKYQLFSAALHSGRRLQWPDDFFSLQTSLTYNLFNVTGLEHIFDEGRANLLTLQQVLERNSTDNPISPQSGSKFNVSGEIAIPLPGFAHFYKLKSQYHHHHTLVGRLVFSAGAEYGYLGYFSDVNRTNFRRFMLGGTQIQQRQSFIYDNIDMRGYPGGFNGTITPVDADGRDLGGRVYSKYSFELRYPAVSSEQIQLIPYTFFDAGNAFTGLNEFDPFDVKRAAGFGARIFLPILGLVDLSYGYRLDGTSNLNPGEWEFLFNIGAPF